MDGKGASQYGRSAGPHGLKGKARCSTEVAEVYGSRHRRLVRGVNQMGDEVGCRLRGQATEVGATRRYERDMWRRKRHAAVCALTASPNESIGGSHCEKR